jgi:hypothetical protein
MTSDQTIIFETILGKYNPKTWKKISDWAPDDSSKNSKEYLQNLKNFII